MALKPSLPRLFVEHRLDGRALTLDERESHYLAHVLRLKRGDELVAFNGLGDERFARIDSLQRRGAVLGLAGEHAALPESPLGLTLVQALPKSDAMDLIVQKATELGVRHLIPVYTEFSVVKLDEARSERRLDHWRKIARSACEQCGRHQPPVIERAATLADALAALPRGAARLALQPNGTRPLGDAIDAAHGVVVAVGPEGGFGPTDLARLDAAGFERVTVGRRVLRAETAAIAVCAIAQSRWGDL